MKSNHLLKTIILLSVISLIAGCGGKSDVTGEVVPIGEVCSYQQTKTVAVEGYLAPKTMRCKKISSKKTSVYLGCVMTLYASADQTGANMPVYIPATNNWLNAVNNRIKNPDDYTEDLQFYDRDGKPLPKKELQIYDNDGNLIPTGSRIRIYSSLPNTERCEFRRAERIEKIS